MKKSIAILELRQLVREIIQEISGAPVSHDPSAYAPTTPAPGSGPTGAYDAAANEKELSKANLAKTNPDATKSVAVVRALAAMGQPTDQAAVQAWLKKQDPTALFSKTAEELADEFYKSGKVGTPPSGEGDWDAEQKAKAKQQALFDKYSSPRK